VYKARSSFERLKDGGRGAKRDGRALILHHNGRVVTDLETLVGVVKRDLVPELFGTPARSRAGGPGPADFYLETKAEPGRATVRIPV